MPHERKLDLRVIKTRNAIKTALIDMIKEKDISEITVKELTDRAMINRKTFYLHYTCIEALFEDLIKDIAEEYFKAIDKIPSNMPMVEVNRVFFEHLSNQDEFAQRMITNPSYSDFSNKLFSINLKHNRARFNPYSKYTQEEQNIINAFLMTSSLEMYRQWVKDGKKMSLESIIKLSGKLLSEGVSSII